ncbi:BON domain-containing protein [Herbiconiux sp. VKM Ac-1786]|uniref:BON domain-containing protein n=1 Tax=Herbiconiux sp. VKM Ac-1786 TaxID=2783824 RepID=UPI00188A678D|nr:BON domain-containing protein [Herbiconiux sp. VKM Ac-1786]MBF4571950.1 BON domain-containing protein [Herbiconiux sp. VKM Ac-1786]
MTITEAAGLTDARIKELVEDELIWTAGVDAPAIGVAVTDGAVTLTGEVPYYWHRHTAAKAVLRMRGVQAVANEITVRGSHDTPTDTEIAAAVAQALTWSSRIPTGEIDAEVHDGGVVLTGQVSWDTTRRGAEREIAALKGVQWVDNRITLAPRASAADTRTRITAALERNALTDAEAIHVHVDGTTAILTGEVRSYDAKHQAELAAWGSPHITEVRNNLIIHTHATQVQP